MLDISQYVRAEHKHVQLLEALQLSPSALISVSQEAASALAAIGINTLFDLGSAWLFANARSATQAAEFGAPSQRLGLVSADWFKDNPVVKASQLENLGDLDILYLRGISDEQATALKAALGIAKVHELAFWPPQQIARQMVGDSVGNIIDVDEIQTELLRPRFAEYPTERVYYSTLVMLDLGEDGTGRTEISAPVSLNPPQQNGFTKIAVGAMLTLSQSWYALGVTLGQMLHSLALAPGEATRIAIIDWTRRTRTSTSELITEAESLDTASSHSRALSEVQAAVADEFQRGGSTSGSTSSSSSNSLAAAAGTGLLPSLVASADVSVTYQGANSNASARTSSWSRGTRSVTASMTQDVNDRTEQHSTSVRNRRASAVREVAQSEHESISTRIVANYNHMHALTVQYYEVVQIYRTVAALHTTERCLFIPMEILNFTGHSGQGLIDKYRGVLIRAALNRHIRSLLMDDTTAVALKPEKPVLLPVYSAQPDTFYRVPKPYLRPFLVEGTPVNTTIPKAGIAMPVEKGQMLERVWDVSAIAHVSSLIDRSIVRQNSNQLFFPDDAELKSLSFDGINIAQIRIDRVGSTSDTIDIANGLNRAELSTPLALNMVEKISISKSSDPAVSDARMFLSLSYLGRQFSTPPIPIELGQGTDLKLVITFETDRVDRRREIQDHLQENRTYYSHVIFESLDSASIVELLAPYQWNGKPLIDQVEPKPLTIAGNFLVLRAPVENHESSGVKDKEKDLTWDELIKERGLNSVPKDTRLIPLPTNGVFAEAVLGRSNSAEKLDITRFWNWQDSPIPLAPTEIAPVSAGSRGESDNLVPGQLGQPVLNILNPTNLPDPVGLSAVLTAIANGNIFRDLSGLVGTQDLARAASQGTLQAASEAGQLASTNLRTEAQKSVAMAQVAADIIKSLYGKGGSGSVQGISGDGARVNHGRSLDERGVSGTNTKPKGNNYLGSSGSSGSGTSTDQVTPNSNTSDRSSSFDGGSTGFSREAAYTDAGALGFSPNATTEILSQVEDNIAGSPTIVHASYPPSGISASSFIPLEPETVTSSGTGGRSIGLGALDIGDIILSTTLQLPSKAIRLATDAPVSHTILYVGDGQVIEAIQDGAVLRPIEAAIADANLAVAFRYPAISVEQALKIKDYAGKQIGKKYDYHYGVVRQALFRLDMLTFCSKKRGAEYEACRNWAGQVNLGTGTNDEFFCSELVIAAYEAGGVPLTTKPPHWTAPGDIIPLILRGALAYVGHLKFTRLV